MTRGAPSKKCLVSWQQRPCFSLAQFRLRATPLSPERTGQLALATSNLTLVVPSKLALALAFNRWRPAYELRGVLDIRHGGRQLLVDDVLISEACGVERRWHAAKLEGEVESLSGYRFHSHGLFWDRRDRLYRLWANNGTLTQQALSRTVAFHSRDGRAWKLTGALRPNWGKRDSISIWVDRDDDSCPFKFSAVEKDGCSAC